MAETNSFNQRSLSGSAFFVTSFVGFGCYMSWSMIADSPSLLAPSIQSIASLAALGTGAQRIIWLIVLIALAVFAFIKKTNFPRATIALVAGILTTGGTFVLYLAHGIGTPQEELITAAQLVTAFSSAFIPLWGERLCQLDDKKALQCVLIASFISFAVVAICAFLPAIVQSIIQIIVPGLSACILILGYAHAPARRNLPLRTMLLACPCAHSLASVSFLLLC